MPVKKTDTPEAADEGVGLSAVLDRLVRLGNALEAQEVRVLDSRSLGAEVKALGLLGLRILEKRSRKE